MSKYKELARIAVSLVAFYDNALVSDDSKPVAGGYKDPNDVGTFWIRKEPFKRPLQSRYSG